VRTDRDRQQSVGELLVALLGGCDTERPDRASSNFSRLLVPASVRCCLCLCLIAAHTAICCLSASPSCTPPLHAPRCGVQLREAVHDGSSSVRI